MKNILFMCTNNKNSFAQNQLEIPFAQASSHLYAFFDVLESLS